VPLNVRIVLFILKKKKKIIFNHVIDVQSTRNNISCIRYTWYYKTYLIRIFLFYYSSVNHSTKMSEKPIAMVRCRINKNFHVDCSEIELMGIDELHTLRHIIVRALDAQRYHEESNASDQFMSWVHGLYHVDITLSRHRRLRGSVW
jgi:hypothetical protein